MSTKQIARDLCLAPERVGDSVYGGRYRRLFENLPPLDSEDEALHALGRPVLVGPSRKRFLDTLVTMLAPPTGGAG